MSRSSLAPFWISFWLLCLCSSALLLLVSCGQQASAGQPSVPTGSTSAQVPTKNASQRNHVHSSMLFVTVTFTASTSYDQAASLLKAAGENLYPWNCDDPRTPVPPPISEQRTAFASSHMLFISYPNLPGLGTLASSPQVLSIDPGPVYLCP